MSAPVPLPVVAMILREWDTSSAAALARRFKLPITTVQSIARRAGKTKKAAGRPRKGTRCSGRQR